MSDEKKVEAQITIDADAATVWRALTDGEELTRWFPLDARVTPGEGGSIWMSFRGGLDWETPIALWEPNRHLRTADPAPSPLAVDYFIEAQGGQTTFHNLCFACRRCNEFKGPTTRIQEPLTGELVPIFHPRQHA